MLIDLPLVQINCREINHALASRAVELSDQLLKKLLGTVQLSQRTLCHRFETVSDKILRVPTDFDEMADSMAVANRLKMTEMKEMQDQVHEIQRQILFLINYSAMSDDQIELNTQTFTWPNRIDAIVQQNEQILTLARRQNEENLLDRRRRFQEELDAAANQVDEFRQVSDAEEMPFFHKKSTALMKQLQQGADTIARFNKEEVLFGWPATEYPERKVIMERLEPYVNLFTLAADFLKLHKKWIDGNFLDLDVEKIEADLDTAKRDMIKLISTSFAEETDPQGRFQASRAISKQVQERIEDFSSNLPLLRVLCNSGLRARHWEQMATVCGFEIRPGTGRESLRKIIRLNLDPWLKQFTEISESASREFALEKAIKKMIAEWEPIEFSAIPYRETGTFILATVDEIQQLLDDHIVKTQSMRGSPFIKPFETEIKSWEAKLILTQDLIDCWLKVQANWMYLEPIFGSQDIQNAMPEEGKKFRQVDSGWRTIMEVLRSNNLIYIQGSKFLGCFGRSTCSACHQYPIYS